MGRTIDTWLGRRWMKLPVWAICLTPVTVLAWHGVALWRGNPDALGPNPIELVIHTTGSWTLNLLVATLVITPLRRLTGWGHLIRYRRLLGMFAFFYGSLHLLSYVGLDQFFAWHAIVHDIGKHRYIMAGMAGFVLLVPLAVTSTRGWVGRLGGKRWQRLHRLIYASALLGVVHYFWLVKSDHRAPLAYGGVVVLLLAARAFRRRRTGAPAPRSAMPVAGELVSR